MSGLGLYHRGFLKVLHLWVLAPPSELALLIGAFLVLQGTSKSSKFAGVGSAVHFGFDYRSSAFIRMDF